MELIVEHLESSGVPAESLQTVRSILLERATTPPAQREATRLEALLLHATEGRVEVKVRTLSGNVCATLDVETGTKVSTLKHLIEAQTAIPARQQVLARHGNLLDDAETVGSIGLVPFDAELSCVVVPANIYAIGGHNEEPLNSVEVLDMRTKTWSWSPPMHFPRHGCVAATVGTCIYVIGGAGEGDGTGEVFDPAKGEWSLLPSMHFPRRNFEVAVVDRQLFVIGGFNGEILASGEVLDTVTHQWSEIPAMSTPRSDFAVVCVNKKLYAVGGFDGEEVTGSAEVFDPTSATPVWRPLAAMAEPRCYFTAAVIDKSIFVVGGQGYATRTLSSGEVLSIEDETWSTLPPMQVPRRYSASSVLDGKLYLFGGRNGTEFLTSAEVFDPEEQQWKKLPELAFPRRGCTHITLGASVYMFGGRDTTLAPIASAQAFDTVDNRWIDLPDMLASRRGFAAAIA